MTYWEHDAQKHGRQLLHAALTRTGGGLPVISPEDTTNCKVLEVAGDGHCALHCIYRLLHPERDSVFGALASEITQTRKDVALEMIAAVFSKDYEQLVDNTVSDEEMLRLGKLDYERGFYRKRTPSAGRAARAVRRKPLKTVREVVAGIEDQLEHDYLAVGQLAIVAAVKRCNIVVWEATTGGGLRIVEMGDTTGCFVGDLYRDEFLHLVYNDFGGYNAAMYAAGGDDEAEYEQEPEGDDDMSDGGGEGSEGEFPGDAADYDQDVFVSGNSPQQVKAMVDKIQEAWGNEALTFIFGLVQNTKQLVQDRNKKKKARSEVEEDAPEGGDTGEEQKGDEALDTADEHSWTTRGMKTDVDWSARYDGGLSGGHDARSGANGGEREGTADDDRSRAGAGGDAAGSFEGDGEGSGRDGNGNGGNVGSGNDGNDDGGDGFDFDGEGSYRGDGHQYYDCHRKREGEGEDVSFKPSKKTLDALPAFDPDKLGRFSVDELGELAFTFFSIMFPAAVILLLVRKTNEYFNFCRSTKNPKGQEQRHRDQKARKGKSSWPKKGITKSMMQGVISIILTIGLVQLPAMHDHWSCHSFHDYKLVRACLPRDMFLLIYGRFFHMASSGAPERLQGGTTEPGWDSLHHIRYELCGWFVHGD
ncbi:unnamed protein product [Ectocarpus sp. CCAP 1310/34]|nr:unnamed protein product [Ectocarpus sp. CCAP 1310/34]